MGGCKDGRVLYASRHLIFVVFRNIGLPVVTQSQISTQVLQALIGLFFWRYADIFSILGSGRHLNSYHMTIFLKLNMETTHVTPFFAKANPRQTNPSFALLVKM